MASPKIPCTKVARAVRGIALLLLALVSAEASARSPKQTPPPSPTATPSDTGSLSIVITDPQPASTIDADRYGVRGTFEGPANTGLTVNDVIAYARDGRFVLNDLPLAAGTNVITATATAPDGRSGTTSVTVQATGRPRPLELHADVSSGIAPLTVTFTYAFTPIGAVVSKLAMDYDGDGRDDFRTHHPPTSVANTYSTPGLYFPQLKVTDSAGEVYTAQLAIEVNSLDERDTLFLAAWNGMNDALLRGNVNEALAFFNARARPQYARVLQGLLPDMPALVGSYAPPQRVSVATTVLEYAVRRVIDGEENIFFVYLLRDADGVWRLDRM